MARSLASLDASIRPTAEYAFQVMRTWTGVTPTLTSALRTLSEQETLYKNRGSNPNPVNAPGDSSHEYGLGFDSVVSAQWRPTWVYILSALGFRVVQEPTAIHAEMPDWRGYLRRWYANGKPEISYSRFLDAVRWYAQQRSGSTADVDL